MIYSSGNPLRPDMLTKDGELFTSGERLTTSDALQDRMLFYTIFYEWCLVLFKMTDKKRSCSRMDSNLLITIIFYLKF